MAASTGAGKSQPDWRQTGLHLAQALEHARTPEEFLLSPAFQKMDVRRLLMLDITAQTTRLAELRARKAKLTELERTEVARLQSAIADMAAKANRLLSLQVTARRRSLAKLELSRRLGAAS
jgi:hypothetical protein